jgi:hypothetical protein
VSEVDAAVEPTLSATYAAAEAARTANHAGYHAPRDQPSNVYDRAGAAFELLRNTEQLVRMLSGDAQRLIRTPGLYSTDGEPEVAVRSAAATIARAAGQVNAAAELVNTAWSELSAIGVRLPDDT